MKNLREIIALIPTPMTDNAEVDETGLKKLIDYELENGCGVGVLAAIGESYLLSHEDWRKVVEVACQHVSGRSPLIVGCPGMGTRSILPNLYKSPHST